MAQTRTSPEGITQQLAKALAHPLRVRILSSLQKGISSPNQLAQELGEPLGNVSYHVKALLELRCVELVDTAQRRGAIEHYYRAVTRAGLDHGAFKKLPASVRSEISGMTVEEAIGDVAQAFKAGTFDGRTDRHASFTRLSLDEQAFGELTEAVGRLLDRALALQTESAGRRRNGSDGGGEVLTGLALLAYETSAG